MNEHDDIISLSIELSSRTGSVALGRGDALLGVEPVTKASRHSDDAMPAVERLFSAHTLLPNDLGHVYVSIGPGGFTGIRLAVTMAKMLALATGARIVPVQTSDVVAQAIDVPGDDHGTGSGDAPSLLVALASKRGMSWCVRYQVERNDDDADRWWEQQVGTGQLVMISELIHDSASASIIAADVIDDALRNTCAAGKHVVVEAQHKAEHCFARARRQLQASKDHAALFADAKTLVPFYVREPEATRLWDVRSRQSK